MLLTTTKRITEKPPSVLIMVAGNDRDAVTDCLHIHGKWVWAVARKFSDSPEAAEQLTLDIFRDIWKYAHRFEASGLDEQVFIALIARRRVRMQPVIPTKSFATDNRFFKTFYRYAKGEHA